MQFYILVFGYSLTEVRSALHSLTAIETHLAAYGRAPIFQANIAIKFHKLYAFGSYKDGTNIASLSLSKVPVLSAILDA